MTYKRKINTLQMSNLYKVDWITFKILPALLLCALESMARQSKLDYILRWYNTYVVYNSVLKRTEQSNTW